VLEHKNATGKVKKYAVPPVLLSGNPKLIDEWKQGTQK
jgi:tRNA G37 N-methylase TrmD